ncbi:type I restriction-modification system subunit M [Anaerotignum sp.]|uniref:type I restriction-modification system subunit M n=1 Tax=Anaerotignum sp. TaxID=2039241 RepID=UPI0028A5C73C|nr:class I SAM-dependent DNA methyltransferase [Anaerotignum sp.]
MTNKELKNLKDTLWQSADTLRADSGLKSSEYATPILGLIFLRFAESKYKGHEESILAEYNKLKGTRMEREMSEIAIEKCGFYLPDEARYEYLLNLPETDNIPEKVKQAMVDIEKYTKELEDTLPKDEYYAVDGKDGKAVVKKLLKTFKDIPDNISIDIFGEIYEYFLGKFALAEGQGGGEFFTPSTVVRYMVEVLSPTEGEIFDPACGSGGMFVQTAHYIAKHKANGKDINLRAYGVEKTGATVKLAKMNLALNNIRGTITEANSYYNDPYSCFGRFDYVMANPPFNVDGIELADVKDQARFNTYGVPQNKTKGKKSAGETVPNGNYLWINMFATSLKENTGKAALVMANSASDAGNSEKDIRIKLIESGIVSQMVTLPSNMFSTVTLPATLWFFDATHKNKDEILFIDARNVFTQIDRAHRSFSDEQIKNLAIISRLYEGETEDFTELINEYKAEITRLENGGEIEETKDIAYWQSNIDWLLERFPDGKYKDVTGLCKAAKIEGEDGIKDQDYSLNPGRYVGVVIEDDGLTEEEFKAEMMSLQAELEKLNNEARGLEGKIAENLKSLFGGEVDND